jgi:phosphohistidine phosphatase
MKTLILMRHAKSDWSQPGQPDKDRPLNPRGRAAAPKMARWMRDTGRVPEAALVSGAVRTRETWELLGFDCEAAFRDELYLAEPEVILAAIQAAPDCETLLVLGHNPGLETAMARMGAEGHVKAPSGATAVFALPVDSWAQAAFDIGARLAFATPKSLP